MRPARRVGPTILGRTARTGLRVATDGTLKWFLTDCCTASATASMGEVVCRACYEEVDPSIGGVYDEAFDGPILPIGDAR